VSASGNRIAGIVRARITIVAVARFPRLALAAGADVVEGTCIAVVARGTIECMKAAHGDITTVVSADVVVVAMQCRGGGACAPFANVAHSAGVVVIARVVIGQVLAVARIVA